MTLERFAFISFVAALLLLILTGCSGDSESPLEPQPQYEMMEYTIVGRITLDATPTEGVPDVTVSIYGPTDAGPGELVAEVTTDATGSFNVRFEGRARASACFPISSNEAGVEPTRGHQVGAHKEGFTTERYTAECGVSHHSWYPRMREEQNTGGCMIYCPPYF